ncbi:MAG: class I SAM-dependent methyltransferase [Ferruginibacter sp.]|nr:class I SAM-dependent methyltransferase [Cytophagales bacterium]
MALTAHLQDAYERQYRGGGSAWRETGARQKAKNIGEVTGGKRFGKVLEVGAGDGSLLQLLGQHLADELYALEISDSALQRIRDRRIPQLREAQRFDGYTIPYADQSFDLVVLSHVLEHVEFERKLLRELRRVARYQVIEVPKDYRFGVDRKVAHFLSYGHINVYTPSSLRFLLRSEGFRILRERIGLYSRATYEHLAFQSGGQSRKTTGKTFRSKLLWLAKRLLVSLPAARLRDHFANTVTVLLEAKSEEVEIFGRPEQPPVRSSTLC